ncbi:Glutathione S-transferase F12 [Leucoagaricus sp. SymC.cos]|nr:Glutathione S-transferase F12 [Leucoagaricus sp. SymC.cos]
MVLKLYGWFSSTPALAAAMLLHEKNVPFEWVEVDLTKSEQNLPEFLAKTPFHEVPLIEDGEFILSESRAIARYLDEKYPNQGTQFYPADVQRRAVVDQITWNDTFHFGQFGTRVVLEILNRKYFGMPTDTKAAEEAKKALFINLDIYETILSKQKYIAGNELTIADIIHIPVAARLVQEVGLNIGEGRPNVYRWVSEIIARESWAKAKEIFFAHPSH